MKFPSLLRPSLLTLCSAAVLPLLAGCGPMTTVAPSVTSAKLNISGSIHGGQQPISGSRVFLFSTGLAYGSASASLLTAGTGVATDSNGNGYVTSDANGNFTLTNDYTCPSFNTAIPTYLLATGGNPGLAAGTANSAIALIASLGPCSSLTASTFISINEVTTVAAVTALQQFMTDGTHIGAPPSSAQPSYSDVQSIANAMSTAASLASPSSGFALTAPVGSAGTSPRAKVDTLANILATCINTAAPTSSQCAALFAATTPTGGTAPANTIAAMLQIAKNPGTNVATSFGQSTAYAPFQPSLAAAPNDFTLPITYTAGINYPGALTIDNAGDVFVAVCPSCSGATGTDSIVGFTPTGAIKTTGGATFATNVHKPLALRIDRYNALWVAEGAAGTLGNQLTRVAYDTGTVQSGFPVALNGTPGGMALVENSPAAAWVTDSTNARMTLINNDGTTIGGVNTNGLTTPTSLAADGLENLYVLGANSTNVLKFSPIYDRTQQFGTLSPVTTGNFSTIAATGAGFSAPVSLALDGGDHLWTVNTSNKGVSELFAYNSTATSGATGYTGSVNTATQVTIDGAGTAWIANCRKSCTTSGSTAADNIVHLSAAGASITVSDGFQDASLATPTASAIDVSGNLWISNTTGASLTELVGVAVPVATELETASSRHALPAVNYLLNPSFELGGGSSIPNWTLTTNATSSTSAQEDTSNPFSGQQKLTFYNGSPYVQTESQTMSGLSAGNYLVSCYIASGPGSTTRTTSLIASGYNGSATTSVTPTDLTYTFQPYSVLVPVNAGTLTVGLYNNETSSGGGYTGWDSCSVTKQ